MMHNHRSLSQPALPASRRIFAFIALAILTASTHAAEKLPVAPPSATAPSSTGNVFTMIFGLLVVLAIMAAIAWLVKRTGLNNISGSGIPLKVVGGVSVGTRERVMVVEVADQWIVVGVAPGSVNTLATLPRQEYVPAKTSPAAKDFASWLKHTLDKRHDRS
jgi:flagellar protein FliO/FliZ